MTPTQTGPMLSMGKTEPRVNYIRYRWVVACMKQYSDENAVACCHCRMLPLAICGVEREDAGCVLPSPACIFTVTYVAEAALGCFITARRACSTRARSLVAEQRANFKRAPLDGAILRWGGFQCRSRGLRANSSAGLADSTA